LIRLVGIERGLFQLKPRAGLLKRFYTAFFLFIEVPGKPIKRKKDVMLPYPNPIRGTSFKKENSIWERHM